MARKTSRSSTTPKNPAPATPAFKQALKSLVEDKRLFWAIALGGLVLDLGSKMWAEASFRPEGWTVGSPTPVHPFIEGVFAWKWAGNLGAAFSMFEGRVFMLAAIGLLALCAILWYVHKTEPGDKWMQVSLGLIASGAIGNIYDRIQLGWVRDFMYFDFDLPFHESVSFIPQRYPVFNVADIAILSGAILLIGLSVREARREAREKAEA